MSDRQKQDEDKKKLIVDITFDSQFMVNYHLKYAVNEGDDILHEYCMWWAGYGRSEKEALAKIKSVTAFCHAGGA